MKRTVSLFIYIVAAICAMAQTKKGPEFPGGEEMLRQFLKENVQYPYAIESRKTYNVKAEVLVAKDGTVKLFDILKPKSLKHEIENETKRVIKIMPKWNPGGHYTDDGTFVPEQWKTTINICFNPLVDCHEEITCINVEKAGTLSLLLTQAQKDTCSQLRIMGKINSADIITLREMAGENGHLEFLDLSGVYIVTSKEPYLQIEDAEKVAKLWASSVRGSYSYSPSWTRTQDYEQDGNKNKSWGTPYHNKPYPSGSGRYDSPTPYNIPYRERTQVDSFRSSIKKWGDGKSNSYGRAAICLFEEELGLVPNGRPKELKPTHFKGHKLEYNGEKYILTAHTAKNSFCRDMFYHCPKLKLVIIPIHATVNDRSVIRQSHIRFIEVHTPQY